MSLLVQLGKAALSVALLAAVVGLAWRVGTMVLRHSRLVHEAPTAIERWHLPLACGVGCLGLSVLALGLLRQFTGWAFALMGVAWLLITGLTPRASSLPVRTPPPNRPLQGWTTLERFVVVLLAAHVLLQFVGALAPPTFFDTLVYHLGLPQLFVRQHHVWDGTGSVMSCYPLLMQMLYSVGVAWRCEVFGPLLNWFLGGCTALLLYQLGTHWFNRRVGLWSVVCFYATPIVNTISAGAFVDLALTWVGMLAVWSLLQWEHQGQDRSLVLCALCVGLALMIKATGVMLALLLGGRVLWVWCRARGKTRSAKSILAAGCLALGLGSVWVLYNWVTKADPWCHVTAVRTVGWTYTTPRLIWNDLSPLTPAGVGQLIQHLAYALTGLVRVIVWPSAFDGWRLSPGPGGLLLVGWLLALPRVDRRIWWLVAFALAFTGGAALSGVEASRFFTPVYPWLAMIGGYVLWRLSSDGLSRLARGYAWVMCGFAVVNLGLLAVQQSVRIPAALGLMSREAFLRERLDSFSTMQHANTQLPAGSRVLTMDPRVYYLTCDYVMGDGSYQIWLRWPALADAQALAARLRERGITHVLVTWPYARDFARRDTPMRDEWQAFLRLWDQFGPVYTQPVFEDRGCVLYALRDA